MKLAVEYPSVAYREGPEGVARLARAIEDIGYDQLDVFDHVVMGFPLEGRAPGPLAFIAGGVGFAPVMGMLRDLHARANRYPVRIVYGNRVEGQILFREELDALGFPVDYVLSEPPEGWHGRTGELTPHVLAACLDMPDRAEWLYFVCGPAPMMDSVERTLRGWGVPRARIVAERFTYA